jgi:hypothetical protein
LTIQVKIAITALLYFLGVSGACLAETTYFENRLTLPDFPGFQVFVEEANSTQKGSKRWSLSGKPTAQTNNYLLVDPKKDLWVTVSMLHTPYGGKEPLAPKKFEDEFVTRIAGTTATLSTRKTLSSKYAGNVGYYFLKDKSNKYGTRLLYVPGAPNNNYGDKRAYAIAITYTTSSADRAKVLTQKLLDNMKVSRKK